MQKNILLLKFNLQQRIQKREYQNSRVVTLKAVRPRLWQISTLHNMSYTQIKLVAVGDGACGKTSALLTFAAGMFPVEYVPTVFDNFATNLMVDKVPINLNLWGMSNGIY
jgi:GTPase SAR1 family protein